MLLQTIRKMPSLWFTECIGKCLEIREPEYTPCLKHCSIIQQLSQTCLQWTKDFYSQSIKVEFLAVAQSTVHTFMEKNFVITQISLKRCREVVCLQIQYVLKDLTTKCNMMFGTSEPLSQKPIYFFTSDSIKFFRRKLHFLERVLKIEIIWLVLLQFCRIMWWV